MIYSLYSLAASEDQLMTTRSGALRSRAWFDNPANPDITALYLEKYLNYGLSLEELQGGRPIIGIAQTGSDLRPATAITWCWPSASREGIREAGGIADGVPGSSDPGNRQAADRGARSQPRLSRPGRSAVRLSARRRGADDRLRQDDARLSDGGGDREHSGDRAVGRADAERLAQAASASAPGTIVWKARELLAAGEIDYKGFIKLVASSAPSTGYCNTMGTATTMNSLAEALGHVAARLARRSRRRIAIARNAPGGPAGGSSRWCAPTASRPTS